MVDKQGKSDHNHNRDQNGDDRLARDLHIAEHNREGRHHRGGRLCRRAENQKRYILQKVADADGRNQHGKGGCRTERLVGDFFNRHTEHRAYENPEKNRQPHGHPQRRADDKGHVPANHDDIAMCEVQHFRDTIYHGVTECNQGIDTAETHAVNQVREETAHRLCSLL